MADVIVEAKIDSLSRIDLAGMTREAIARAMARATVNIDRYAKDITPVSVGWKHPKYGPRGALRESFKVHISGKVIHMIWDAPYAKWADEGATPHLIAGNPLLHFYWWRGGRWVKTEQVRHPGYIGARFSDQMRIVAPQFVREAIIEELQRMNIP